LLTAIVAAQAALGVATLISEVPIALGVAHQAGALLSFTVAILVVYELRLRPSAVAADRPNSAAPSR
jgi:cytochrome c oxidase assembly protein subunit 15